MSKHYTYTKRERAAEREIDRFLAAHQTTSSAPAGNSVLEELRALAAEK